MRNLITHLSTHGAATVTIKPRNSTPRRLPFTPEPPTPPVAPKARVVRPYVLAADQQRRVRRADSSRLGLEVLLQLSHLEVAA